MARKTIVKELHELVELRQLRDSLVKERNELQGKLDGTVHQNIRLRQDNDSLLWALRRAILELRKIQLEAKTFSADKVEWEKAEDSLALAE